MSLKLPEKEKKKSCGKNEDLLMNLFSKKMKDFLANNEIIKEHKNLVRTNKINQEILERR